jgi:hypothetical protein
MNRLLARPAVIITALAGVGLVVLAGGRPWVSQTLPGVPGVTRATASGNQAAPAVTAVALVAAAGAVALALTGRVTRRIVAVLLVVAGLGVVGLTVTVLQDPAQAVLPAVQNATGRVGSPPPGPAAVLTGWIWPALVGGVLVVVGGVTALFGSGRWGSTGRRFETAGGPATVTVTTPTEALPSPAAGETTGAAETTDQAPTAAQGSASARARRDSDLDAWDALSRGEDPTAG